jgi:hypothetical protein
VIFECTERAQPGSPGIVAKSFRARHTGRMVLRRFVLGGVLLSGACGDDEASDGDGTSPTSTSPSTTDASSGTDPTSGTGPTTSTSTSATSDATEDSTSTVADSGSGDVPFDLPCGDALVCTGGDVCIEDAFEPECTNLEDPKGMCPDGQTMTNCGGVGIPCCCLPPPASEYRCVTPTSCEGPATCDCLGEEVCTLGRVCISLEEDPEHMFLCYQPAEP